MIEEKYNPTMDHEKRYKAVISFASHSRSSSKKVPRMKVKLSTGAASIARVYIVTASATDAIVPRLRDSSNSRPTDLLPTLRRKQDKS